MIGKMTRRRASDAGSPAATQGHKGALLGAAAPWLLRRAFTPLGIAAIGAYGAKKYSTDAAPAAPFEGASAPDAL